MNDVRVRLAKLIALGLAGRTFNELFEQLNLYFRINNESLSWATYLEWSGGLRFPATRRRQFLLADKIGGKSGDEIRQLKAPPFRGKRHKIMKEHDVSMNSKNREFHMVMREYGETRVPHAQIVCAECGFSYHHLRRGSVDTPDYFRKRGWRVGTTAAGDICPMCLEKKQHHKRATGKVVHMEDHRKDQRTGDTVTEQAAFTVLSPTLPEGMTKEEGRLISRLIDDHWDADKSRYQAGWNDVRIAEDGGKSLMLVKFVRERDFDGPGEDPNIEEFLSHTLKLENEIEDLGRRFDEWSGSTTMTMLEDIKTKMVDIGAAVNKDSRLRTEYQEKHSKVKAELHRCLELAKTLQPNLTAKKKY